MKKKKLLIVLCVILAAVAIATASIAGTVAYMIHSSYVSNVFTVGNVKLLLRETKVDNQGNPVEDSAGNTTKTDTNSYHLMPGHSYTKDPTITVDPSTESCYLFLVTTNQIVDIEAKDKPTMAEQMKANGWAIFKEDLNTYSCVWVYCGPDQANKNDPNKAITVCGTNAKLKPEGVKELAETDEIKIFTAFHVDENAEKNSNFGLYESAKVTLKAVGIQSEAFSDDPAGTVGGLTAVQKAWAAVLEQDPFIETAAN